MPTGVIILFVLQIIIYFGLAEEMLRKMGISRGEALLLLLAMIAGSYIDLPLLSNPPITVNLGGALIPAAFAIYVLARSDEKEEVYRTIFAVLVTGGVIFLLTQIYQFEEGHTAIDTNYLFPLVAGITAYLAGRSRRAAFISGVLGFLVYDLIHAFRLIAQNIPGEAWIGGAGVFDTIVISGVIAVLTAEIIGETREYIKRKDKSEFKKNQFDFEIGEAHKSDDQNEKEE